MRLHSLPTYLHQFRPLTGLRFYLADLLRAILDPHSRITYSQWGEDLALQCLLGTKPGFYVEVGANHPQFFSNVFELYRRGWHGISIEANESFIRAHRRSRPRDRIVCAVVSDREKEMVFTEFKESLVSSVDPAFVDLMHKTYDRTIKRQHRVQTRTLTNILDEAQCPLHFDLLSIDVEGHDFEVLRSLDFSRYRPRVVVIEMHDFAIPAAASNPLCEFMDDQGYDIAGHLATNSYFRDRMPEST
jgi:FkbM family methyltransferase